MVNNVIGGSYLYKWGSLRQGNIPRIYWFSIGLDPLLTYLERRLKGIPIFTLPIASPVMQCDTSNTLLPQQELYKLCAYADDFKSSISSMQEFNTVIDACSLLERASGVKLHRDPTSGKVKFMPLSHWR